MWIVLQNLQKRAQADQHPDFALEEPELSRAT